MRDRGEVAQDDGLAVAVARAPEDRQCLLEGGLCLGVPPEVEVGGRHLGEGGALQLGVARAGEDLSGLREVRQGGGEVAVVAGQHRQVAQTLADQRRPPDLAGQLDGPGEGDLRALALRGPGERLALRQGGLRAERVVADLGGDLDRPVGMLPRLLVLAVRELDPALRQVELHLARRVQVVDQRDHRVEDSLLGLPFTPSVQQALLGEQDVEAQVRVAVGCVLQGAVEHPGGLGQGVDGRRPGAGAEVPDRRGGVVGPLEVLRDHGGVLVGAAHRRTGLGQPGGRAPVVALAVGAQDAVVRHVAEQRVLEQELAGGGELGDLPLQHDLAAAQVLEKLRAPGPRRSRGHRRGGRRRGPRRPGRPPTRAGPVGAPRCSASRAATAGRP